MALVNWTQADAVFISEIDDDHKEIFAALAAIENVLAEPEDCCVDLDMRAARLINSIEGHFASEERLMRAARYASLNWHKRQHDHARNHLKQIMRNVKSRDTKAATIMLSLLKSWLHDHMRLPDMMMGAFLRNQRRVGKITFQTSTRPIGDS